MLRSGQAHFGENRQMVRRKPSIPRLRQIGMAEDSEGITDEDVIDPAFEWNAPEIVPRPRGAIVRQLRNGHRISERAAREDVIQIGRASCRERATITWRGVIW